MIILNYVLIMLVGAVHLRMSTGKLELDCTADDRTEARKNYLKAGWKTGVAHIGDVILKTDWEHSLKIIQYYC